MKLKPHFQAWLTRHPRLARRVELFNRRRRMWITLFILFCHFLGAITSVHAIMGVRTAQGAVAWAVSLNTVPYVAVPAYGILRPPLWNLTEAKVGPHHKGVGSVAAATVASAHEPQPTETPLSLRM